MPNIIVGCNYAYSSSLFAKKKLQKSSIPHLTLVTSQMKRETYYLQIHIVNVDAEKSHTNFRGIRLEITFCDFTADSVTEYIVGTFGDERTRSGAPEALPSIPCCWATHAYNYCFPC
uniref:Uncharacterized protein n=1 Tax=Parascaris univalens TaxID=6257 RepID=A0A915APN1_PARUN